MAYCLTASSHYLTNVGLSSKVFSCTHLKIISQEVLQLNSQNEFKKCTFRITSIFLKCQHYNDVIVSAMASQITSLTIVYSTVYSGANQRKYQSSVSLPFVWGIHRWPGNFPHKWPLTRKMFPFDDVIMNELNPITASISVPSFLRFGQQPMSYFNPFPPKIFKWTFR